MKAVDEIFGLFERRGAAAYFGEPVSQLEHALQTASRAAQEGAPESLIVAALLHDLGHLLHQLAEDVAEQGVDARHEEIGSWWLAWHFGPAVTEPIRLHVAAKRYLCAVDAGYRGRLSPASSRSLALQGGVMSEAEARGFESLPFGEAAVRLRRWDEAAKLVGVKTPDLPGYRSLIEGQTQGAPRAARV